MIDSFPRKDSGIPGLDELLEGGFPYPSVILVSGSAGTGKTTFAQKFLFAGAEKGQQGLYFTTLSEPTQWMLRFATRFSFVDRDLFGKEVVYMDLGNQLRDAQPYDILSFIDEKIADVMPERIIIDPVTVIDAPLGREYRSFLFDLCNRLKNWKAVTILTGEVPPGELYPPEVAYAVDGIILLHNSDEGDGRRKYLEVLKMRGTNHLTGKHSMEITTDEGIVVLKSQF
jgi:circadian clock protein KaiC